MAIFFTAIKNYTDTADTGDDYLCSINYGVYNGEAYVLNVLYTKDGMEITEPATAKMLTRTANVADIESNRWPRFAVRLNVYYLKNIRVIRHRLTLFTNPRINRQESFLTPLG